MIVRDPETSSTATSAPTPIPARVVDGLAMYYDNGNGRTTFTEAKAHGTAPVYRGHPAFEFMRDSERDGMGYE